MDEKEKDLQAPQELEVSGGTMRGNIVINKTTSISEDTKKNI